MPQDKSVKSTSLQVGGALPQQQQKPIPGMPPLPGPRLPPLPPAALKAPPPAEAPRIEPWSPAKPKPKEAREDGPGALPSSIAVDASLGPVIVREAPEISSLTTPSLPVGALGPTSVIVLPRARARRGKGKLFLGGVLALSALGVVGYLMLWPDAPAQEKAQAALLHHPPAMKAGAPAPAPDVPVASAPTSPEEGKEPETSVAPAPPEAETLTTTGEVRLVRLEILTSPDGALVELDGEPLGETPLIRKIPYGEEKALLRITKEGLAPLEISFTPNALYRNTFTLKPEGKAKKAASRAKSRRGRRGRRGR